MSAPQHQIDEGLFGIGNAVDVAEQVLVSAGLFAEGRPMSKTHADYVVDAFSTIFLCAVVAVWASFSRRIVIKTGVLLSRKSVYSPLSPTSSGPARSSAEFARYGSALVMIRIAAYVSYFLICARFLVWNVFSSSEGNWLIQPGKFTQLFLAGGVCALISHVLFTPLDVVKTRIQTSPAGAYAGMIDAAKRITREEGLLVLMKGISATAMGYFVHGAFKFAFYELFKLVFSATAEDALHPSLLVAAASGFFAEMIAAVFLCPMEAVRIRSVVDKSFPLRPLQGLRFLYQEEGIQGLYKGLLPILLKQVPYTISQFVAFEFSLVLVKSLVDLTLGPAARSSASVAGGVSFVAGALAGVFAAIISQPPDTILSKLNQQAGEGSVHAQIVRIARPLWFRGLYLGVGARLIHVACVVSCQFAIYDSIKLLFGIQTAVASQPVAFAQFTDHPTQQRML